MSLTNYLKPKPAAVALKPAPQYVDKRIKRGRKALMSSYNKVRLCQLFLEGEAYSYINRSGAINFQSINPGERTGKPAHRIRNRYNFIRPLVDAKVSSSTSRPPGYEINPTGTDPTVVSAAHLAEKVARMGYNTWYLREARVQASTLAIGGGGRAYALPYFDPMVGPFIKDTDPLTGEDRTIGEGEIKVMVLSRNEVMWEPDVEFHHSRWYAVRTARPIDEVTGHPDYLGGALSADASTSDVPQNAPSEDTVMVTMYFERPCPQYPDGRLLTLANGVQIMEEQTYPLKRAGKVIDKPCIHELSYRLDGEGQGDLGLTWELIDFQRTINDCYNKMLEIKNRALLLRMMAPQGSLSKAPTDEPGSIIHYNPVGGQKPEWEKAPDPSLMNQLLQLRNTALEDMRLVAADADIQAAPNVAANALQAESQQAASRWSQYLGALARWDSDVASHCLLLAQEHYTEQRVLKVRGRYGWEPESSFYGADIANQVDVTVDPATVETHSRAHILQQLGWIQANFPGYLRPEVAIEIAMTGTSAESVIDAFEYDKARANLIIQSIRDGSVMQMPTRSETDPVTGAPMQVPGWMPRPFDNVDIQLWVFETWLKSDDSTRLPPQLYEVAMLVYQGLKHLQAQQAAQAAAAQTMQAEALGQANAAKPQPQDGKPMPSTPNPAGEAPPA